MRNSPALSWQRLRVCRLSWKGTTAFFRSGLIVCFLGINCAAVRADLPVIQTEFIIEAQSFQQGLEEKRAEVEAVIAERMADAGEELFSYLRWQTSGHPSAASAALVLRLVEQVVEVDAGVEGSLIFLEWQTFLIRDGVRTLLPGSLPALSYTANPAEDCQALPEVYLSWESGFPDEDPDQLKTDMRCHLKRHFENESFRDNLQKRFLGQIPISTEIIVDSSLHRVVLPLRWDELKADTDSELLVDFRSEPQGNPGEGTIKLSPSGRILSAPLQDYIQCLIQLFQFAATNTVFSTTFWDDRLVVHLDPHNLKNLGVFMKKYEKDLGPTVLTDP